MSGVCPWYRCVKLWNIYNLINYKFGFWKVNALIVILVRVWLPYTNTRCERRALEINDIFSKFVLFFISIFEIVQRGEGSEVLVDARSRCKNFYLVGRASRLCTQCTRGAIKIHCRAMFKAVTIYEFQAFLWIFHKNFSSTLGIVD